MKSTSLLDRFTSKLNLNALPTREKYLGPMYHYTAAASINPILLNGAEPTLWASRFDCLNDISEGTIPEVRYAEVCNSLMESARISVEFYELIRSIKPRKTELVFVTANNSTRPVSDDCDTYIASFSKDDDALALWNYYSKGSRYEAVNIGFRAGALLYSLSSSFNPEGKHKLQVFEVIYDEASQREIIEKVLVELYTKYEKGDESSVRYHISTMLAGLKVMYKHPCFAHEKEVRLVVQILKKFKDEVPLKYRSYAGYFIPYIELSIGQEAVSQVTMGPMVGTEQQKSLQKAVLHDMLTTHNYYIQEKASQIPVRY